MRVAAVQMDSPAGEKAANLESVARLSHDAARAGARVVLFHEGLLVDYTDNPAAVAEHVPDGPSTKRLCEIAKDCGLWLGVGLAESDGPCLYITQAFCGPDGFVAKYRKTWLWHARDGHPDDPIRDEHKWYNPGQGPEPFVLGGVRVTCLICADGNSERAWRQVTETDPRIVLWPNNRHRFRGTWVEVSDRARQLGRPVVATNRIGRSGSGVCDGGAIIADGTGRVAAHCLRPGEEEIVLADLAL